jgi:thiol-disulfide isomerase/thioredoxin
MKRLLLLSLVSVFAAEGAGPALCGETGTGAGEDGSGVCGATEDGQRISLDDIQGKVVLINFWATWCGPCREALPHIRRIAQKFQVSRWWC